MIVSTGTQNVDWGDGYGYVHLMWCVGCRASWIGEEEDECACTCAEGDADYERWLALEVPFNEERA